MRYLLRLRAWIKPEVRDGLDGLGVLLAITLFFCLLQSSHDGIMKRNRTNLKDAQAKGIESNRKAADSFALNVLPIVRQIQAAGATTHRAIAHALNARGVRTARVVESGMTAQFAT